MLDKRYDHHLVEKDKYQKWIDKGYFTAGDKTKDPFSIVIPPPNVTGKLHLGHAWDTTIQDIIIRYQKMKGKDVLWLPGMDHAGIATQAKVMEKLRNMGIDVTKITREEFLKWAWSWKDEYANTIHQQWAQMGLALDYTRERFTLDEGLNYAVRKIFVDYYNEGLIYQGERIINWDPVQMTALSNVEVIHKDDPGFMYYFKYPIVGTNEYLTVATTRPETMFGDVCVCVNPKDKRYTKYHGMKVINPANHEELPIIPDEYVDIEFGTGAMKCTPAHDPNDFVIGKKYNLEMPIIFNKDATMNEKCGKYKGMDRFACREALINNIKEEGNFVKQDKIIHSVGHSERSDAVVEPMLSKQWFVRMRPLAGMAATNQEFGYDTKVNFIPKRFEKVFLRWMDKAEDWCISRQLWWGHRIPAYYNKHTGEVKVLMDPPEDMENWTQESDVLDTWFSSALWPFSTLGWPNETPDYKRYFPTSVLVTGYDIIFFWVSRMIFQSVHTNLKRPFEKVVIHGLVRDEFGRKMSKTLGNGVDPMKVIEEYGADALRYFLTTNSTPGQDMRYKEEKVQAASNYLNKIWNSARYVLSVLGDDFEEIKLEKAFFSPLDQWIINRLERMINNVKRNMENYNFNGASKHLYNFVYDDFCSQYLEMSKVALNDFDHERAFITKQVLYKCLKTIILIIYPYTPFIAEEIYCSIPERLRKESIMLEEYPKHQVSLTDKRYDNLINLMFAIIKDVRNYKSNCKLPPNAKLKLATTLDCDSYEAIKPFIERFTFSEFARINDANEAKSGDVFFYDGAQLFIINEEDKETLIARIKKEIDTLTSEIDRCNKMLNNEMFLANAPEEKVSLEREKLKKHTANRDALLKKLQTI